MGCKKMMMNKQMRKVTSAPAGGAKLPMRPAARNAVRTQALKTFFAGKSKKVAAAPVAPVTAPAQSFAVRIPGKLFQANNDIVWNVSLGFTKANELFVGRMAMLGFAASLIGEVLTGQGPLNQLNMETGIPLSEAEPLLLFSIVLLGLTAVNEGSGKFVDE